MRKLFLYITLFLSTAVILASLGSAATSENFWWMKILDFPRLQLLFSAAILLVALAWLTKRWDFLKLMFGLGLATAVAIQLYFIYPYSGLVKTTAETVPPDKKQVDSTFDLVVVNVYIHNRQTEELFQILEETDPDMVLAIETDTWWEKALQPLDKRYPYGMEYPLNNGYGLILYSRLPLHRKEIKFLNYPKVPSFHVRVKLPGGDLFGFHGVHPVPPLPGKPGVAGGKEMALRKIGKMVESDSLPAVVAGDLNDVAWARRERLFEQEGLLNDLRIGRAIINTYNAQSHIIRWPLDYVYVTNEFGVVDLRRLRDFGSDHFPLYVELSLLNKGPKPQ